MSSYFIVKGENMERKKIISELNILRKKTLTRLVALYFSCFFFVILLLSLLSNYFLQILESHLLFFIIVPIGILLGVLHKKIVKGYRLAYKKKIIPIAIEQFGENISFSDNGISKEAASKSDMFGYFTVYKSEDLIEGAIEDIKFSSADVKLGYYTGGKHRRYVSVCHGQLYVFDFNKTFRSKTIIREKMLNRPSGLEKIKLENKVFNDKFFIYSNNLHDAFYILTPHFMEKLLLFEQKYPGNLFFSFYNNQLYIGIDNRKDLFEPPLINEINQEVIDRMTNDFRIIKDIIINLKLNNDIFKVEEVSNNAN